MDKTKIENLTEEQIKKAMACKTPEELVALAKAEGMEITTEQAEAYLSESADIELDDVTLKKVAGGCGWVFELYCSTH